MASSSGVVEAVGRNPTHSISKPNLGSIRLIAGLGVADDAHQGETAEHLSHSAVGPDGPNLRQVHLIHAELHDELRQGGFRIAAGQMGENITTRGIDLIRLPLGARLVLGSSAVVEITGLRNPCAKLEELQKGLMRAVLGRDDEGRLVRKAGVMSIVVSGGEVRIGDPIAVELPPLPHHRLEVV